MTVTNKDLIASMAMKDTIREALAVNPMSYSEMLIYFNLEKGKLTNHMTQLKKYGFVKYAESEKHLPKDKRKYYLVPDMGSYADLMELRRAGNYQMTWKEAHRSDINKNATTIVFCDQYHTKGNVSKSSAWSGYSSMAGF